MAIVDLVSNVWRFHLARWVVFVLYALAILLLLMMALMPGLVHAEVPGQLVPPIIPPDPTGDPGELAKLAIQFVQQKNGTGIAAVILVTLVWVSRKIPATTKVGAALRSKWGGWATNFGLSMGVGLLGGALANVTVTPLYILSLVLSSVTVSLSAAGVVELGKDLFGKKVDPAPAVNAGLRAVEDPNKTLGQ